MTAFLFLESMGKKKHIFVKSSHFLATVWLRRGMEIAQNAVYNSTRRLHSVTKFSCLYVQKAQNLDLLPCRSLRRLPLFLFLMDIDLNSFRWEKGLGKLKMGGETRFSPVRLSGHFCIFFLVSSITTQQFNNHTISSMTMH